MKRVLPAREVSKRARGKFIGAHLSSSQLLQKGEGRRVEYRRRHLQNSPYQLALPPGPQQDSPKRPLIAIVAHRTTPTPSK